MAASLRSAAQRLILGRSSLFYGDLPAIATGPPSKIRFVEYANFFDKDRPWVYNTSSLVVERAAFLDAGRWSEDIFYQDIQDLLNKLSVAGGTDIVLAPDTVLYRMHSTNAVRQIAPFIEGIQKLLTKAKQGAYPGDRAVRTKRAVWFGGLIFYWAKEGMRNGHFRDGLNLICRQLVDGSSRHTPEGRRVDDRSTCDGSVAAGAERHRKPGSFASAHRHGAFLKS